METRVKGLVIGASIILGAIGGYYAGFASARSASRSVEAAQDLLDPAAGYRDQRIRREGIRSELRTIMERQARSYDEHGTFVAMDSIPWDTERYLVEVVERPFVSWPRDQWDVSWMAVARHEASPIGEVCAVAVNVEPAYLAGVPLRRAGRVRCSWDFSTWLNRLMM